MARSFASASTQSLTINQAVVSTLPFSMACWVNAADLAAEYALMSICNSGVDGNRQWNLLINTGGNVLCRSINSLGSSSTSTSNSGGPANTWFHAGAMFEATNSRRAVRDAVIDSPATASHNLFGVDRTCIGVVADSAPAQHFNGIIAEAAIWGASLIQGEWTALAKGVSPLAIRPGSLVAYWPLLGNVDPESDIVGGFNLTLNNGPTKAAHCRVYRPARQIVVTNPGAAPPATPRRRRVFAIAS